MQLAGKAKQGQSCTKCLNDVLLLWHSDAEPCLILLCSCTCHQLLLVSKLALLMMQLTSRHLYANNLLHLLMQERLCTLFTAIGAAPDLHPSQENGLYVQVIATGNALGKAGHDAADGQLAGLVQCS